ERASGLRPAAERARGGDDELRRRLELARVVALAVVLAAADQHVQLDRGVADRRQLTRGRRQHAGAARGPQELGVAADEVDGAERAVARRLRHLHRGDRAASARLLPDLVGVHDLARLGHPLDPGELDPLQMSYDRTAHLGSLTPGRDSAFPPKMNAVAAIPPFEQFYSQHRDEVFGFLAKRLGRARAEDAFQETFLRALRAYPRLEHGTHLRAWVLTIAGRIAIDEHRRRKHDAELP